MSPKLETESHKLKNELLLPMSPSTRLIKSHILTYIAGSQFITALRIIYIVITVSGLPKRGIEFISVRKHTTLQCGEDMLP
jgi:hypothetical protein